MTKHVLQRLIALEGDCEKLVGEARDYLRNVQAPPTETMATLQLTNIDRALELYVEGDLSGKQIQEWAEILEMNEQVDYQPGAEEVIADVLLRLSSPEINEPISQAVARELRVALAADG